jgi:hypothetical protein
MQEFFLRTDLRHSVDGLVLIQHFCVVLFFNLDIRQQLSQL